MRPCLALLVTAVALGLPAGPADGHHDEDLSAPAPDALAAGAVSYPSAAVSTAVARRLDAVVDRAYARGLNLKVALIADRDDLGEIPDFFGRPDEYASFLAGQLPGASGGTGTRAQLLVVMPSGFGFDNWPEAGRGAVHGLELSVDASPDDVARAAALAVQRTMRAVGRPVRPAFDDRFDRGARLATGDALLVGALILAGAVASGAGLRARRRGAARERRAAATAEAAA